MEHMTWINGNIDFGIPCKLYTVQLRTQLGQDFYEGMKKMIPDKDNTAALMDYVERFLCAQVPCLTAPGLIVAGLSCELPRQRWTFWVCHPSLPRQKGHELVVESLERCPICKQPMPYNDPDRNIRRRGEWGIDVCSEACSKVPCEAAP